MKEEGEGEPHWEMSQSGGDAGRWTMVATEEDVAPAGSGEEDKVERIFFAKKRK